MIFLFDCFGVVVDWSSDYVMPDLARFAGVSEKEMKSGSAELLEQCETGAISMKEMWSRLGKKFKVKPSGLENILVRRFRERARLNDGVVKIVQSLPAVLFSNQLPVHAEICEENGWFSYFDKVFLSFKLGFRKPDPKSYESVLKKLNIKPSDAVFIDDKEKNVQSAVKLGMRGVLFKNSAQLARDLKKFISLEKR